jgi:DNA-binding transcriptional MerR regulator
MATKTIDHMDFYVDVTPYQHETVSDQTFNVINVCVAYRKGQGFVAYYHPGWNTGWGGFGCVFDFSKDPLTAGFTVPVEQATKNSVKRLTVMHESLKLAAEGIRYFFDSRDWQMLRWLMENTARVGYTPTIEAKVREHMEAETTETTKDNNSNNNQNSEDEIMTNENVKVADLIGRSISNGGNAKYTINSIEGDKVSVTFQMGDSEGKPMTMGVAQVEKLLAGGWQVSDGTQEPTEKKADGGSQKAEEPKAKTVKMEKPKQEKPKAEKPKVTLKRKQPQTEAKAEEPKREQPQGGRYRFSTYTRPTSDGGTKTLGRIDGLQEGDELMQRGVAEKIHASPMYDRDGERKVWWLSFGKRYVEAGRKVCQALNEGRSLEDCQAIVDAQTDENHAQSEARRKKNAERRAAREARKATTQPSDTNHQPSSGKVYTEAEVADLMRRVIEGDKEAIAIVNAMAA